MKKFIYSALFALATTLAVTSCTEEEVTPTSETSNKSGGGERHPIIVAEALVLEAYNLFQIEI
jgi:hypothetical protein